MVYIIMCGGNYSYFEHPKALTEVHGEALVDRTIWLLQKAGVSADDIKITASDPRLEGHGVEVLRHENDFKVIRDERRKIVHIEGYWLDAFIRVNVPVCYLFGDVYYTEKGIKTIAEHDTGVNTLFGTIDPDLKPWEEPLAYKVYDTKAFFEGVQAVKDLHDRGQCNRHPIVWELYRYLNGINVNQHVLDPRTYKNVPGGGMDVDGPEDLALVERYYV